jgi:uncharacterized paraquat-inducible protein A
VQLTTAKTTCKVCGNDWQRAAAYCPRCGSPVLSRPRWSLFWELTVVIAALLVIFWLTVRTR